MTEQHLDLKLPPAAAKLDIRTILDESRLVRLHPHWFVDREERFPDRLKVRLRDYVTDREFSLALHCDGSPAADDPEACAVVLRITLFDTGVRELLFYVAEHQSRVRIRYRDQQACQEHEQDNLLWIRAIQEYLRLYATTTLSTLFFRFFMNRVMLQMNPSQRKICIMITKITVIELLVIIILVAGYVYFS